MTTGLIYDERFLLHDTGPGHPENAERLRVVVNHLHDVGLWERLIHPEFTAADMRWIERVHDPSYLRDLRSRCSMGERSTSDPDTTIGSASFDIARLAAGGVLAGVDAVMAGEVDNVLCLVRPPGHHAERYRAMGFCLLNNVAVAAEYLTVRYAMVRVAIVDFDVHHGNGTQAAFWNRDDILYISLHEHPAELYPGTGYTWEQGAGPGKGYTLNLPLPSGSGDQAYQEAFQAQAFPALDQFKPKFLLVSAGFDIGRHDPLADQEVSDSGFAWIATQLRHKAEQLCADRIAVVLEGGYHLESLPHSIESYLVGMLDPSAVSRIL